MTAISRIVPHPEQHHPYNFVCFKQGTVYRAKNQIESGQDYENTTDPTALVNEVIAAQSVDSNVSIFVKKELGVLGVLTHKQGVHVIQERHILNSLGTTQTYTIFIDGSVTFAYSSKVGKQHYENATVATLFNNALGNA